MKKTARNVDPKDLVRGERRIEYLPLHELTVATRNPKNHDEENIDRSLGRFGYTEPILIDERTERLVAGHGRLQALIRLRDKGATPPDGIVEEDGQWRVPVIRGWASRSDEEAESYLIASNQLTIAGGWDNAALGAMLLDLSDKDPLNLVGLGFDDKMLSKLLDDTQPKAGKTDPDDVPDKIGDITVELGHVYRLGEHVLTCGDSTVPAVYERILGQERADIIWTDPPWNVDYGANTNPAGWSNKHEKIANDNLGEAFPGFCHAFSMAMVKFIKKGAPLYLAMSAQEWPTIHAALLAAGFHWSSTIIWAKDSLVLSRKDYHTQYEPLWYGWEGSAARLKPVEDRTQSDVWNVPRPKRSDDHPTMKPVELIERALVNSTERDGVVLEPFSGSGSVIMACERVGRRARAIELAPKYVQTTIVRWEAFTNKKAERIA
jgi:DNA modification methylase